MTTDQSKLRIADIVRREVQAQLKKDVMARSREDFIIICSKFSAQPLVITTWRPLAR